MNCNCSIEQNYEVIGLCDPLKTIGSITTKEAWTQISVPEVLNIPSCKPDIESIDKIFINAKIVSTRVIKTAPNPPASITNIEGTKLTGKKLIVDGVLCQTIVYTANNLEQSVHSAHFNVPFSAFIVLDENTDTELDDFCVDICIEDVYATVLNLRKIFKNVTLFLKAKKVTIQC